MKLSWPEMGAFLDHLRARAYAAGTVENYARVLENLGQWLANSDLSVFALTAQDARRWLAIQQNKPTKAVAARRFYAYLVASGQVKSNPFADLHHAQTPPAEPKRYLSQTDLAHLCQAVGHPKGRALIEFLYATGARIHEALALDVADLDRDTHRALGIGLVRLRGKGQRERAVFFGPPCAAAIQAMLSDERRTTGPLFTNEAGGRMTVKNAQNLLRRCGNVIGLPGLHPHELRAAFATHLLENGAPEDDVRRLLGHEDLATTMRYLVLTDQALDTILERSAA